jgi:putative NADH-flavin reductase
MKILIFGATGMVGQGVLRECLLASDVELVQTVGRTATHIEHPKLRELLMADLYDYGSHESQLQGFDACFFCLGVSSSGMNEKEYHHMTYDLTMAAAKTLARLNPQMHFAYVSGAGTDSSERGRTMWARVKGSSKMRC